MYPIMKFNTSDINFKNKLNSYIENLPLLIDALKYKDYPKIQEFLALSLFDQQ